MLNLTSYLTATWTTTDFFLVQKLLPYAVEGAATLLLLYCCYQPWATVHLTIDADMVVAVVRAATLRSDTPVTTLAALETRV